MMFWSTCCVRPGSSLAPALYNCGKRGYVVPQCARVHVKQWPMATVSEMDSIYI